MTGRDRSRSLRPGSRIHRSAAARAAPAGDEIVLLHLERGVYFSLNPTGAVAWQRIGDGATLGELRDALVERFAVGADEAWRDLVELVAELESEDLIRLEE